MSDTAFDMIRQVMNTYLRAPFVRAVFVCHPNGDVAVGGGLFGDRERKLMQEIAPSAFPPVKRMAQNSGNQDEAQSLSLPDEDIHLLIFWLTTGYYLVVSFSRLQNPYNPPGSAVKIWEVIRSIIRSPEPRESLSILCADLETEIGLERHVHSDKKELGAWPNLHDLSELDVRREQIVTIAQDILDDKLGVIEGARLLAWLRPTVTRDGFDPDFLPFVAVASETDDLPLGKERALWTTGALLEKQTEIQDAEKFHRKQIFAACQIIIDRFGQG